MNILTLNHYAGSPSMGMEYRSYALSCELNARGHHCAIVAGTFSHLRQRNPDQAPFNVRRTSVEGIDWYWIPTGRYHSNGVRRVVSMLSFATRAWLYARRLAEEQQPDVVIASSTYPLDIYAAARIARTAGASLVFELHDMWPLAPQLLGGLSGRHPFIRVMQHAEDYYCRHADLIISVLPNAIEHLASRGLTSDRYAVVPNGVDVTAGRESQAPPESHLVMLRNARAAGRFVVLYAGSVGLFNRLDALLRAVNLVNDIPVQLVIIGQGFETETLKLLASNLGLKNVSFLSPVPRYQLHGLFALADIAYAGVGASPLCRYGISLNKLYEYMMAGVCVLFAGAADVFNDLVSEAGAGLSVAHASPEDIADGIRRLHALSGEERTELGRRGAAYCQSHFAYGVLAERYEAALLWACQHRRAQR
ncbi:glycosyltransferase family 4 protein [Candidatus Cryosericum septentrionale]|jgi:glycosyltransferase involved in cell wall biosynthesis|uniref:Glycosyltransferase WbuB n=1 Tax=Candidatus Cryosericum septentrionale TaxID=2290913 RepID=A0A398E043_9BACT|nr:glycosyltransferase family 4 protein [Candidatus Cryosericum septentrionale]RIE16001.1 glycosyltransferase WbuB [Candidatus Cryosericum septentrionale]